MNQKIKDLLLSESNEDFLLGKVIMEKTDEEWTGELMNELFRESGGRYSYNRETFQIGPNFENFTIITRNDMHNTFSTTSTWTTTTSTISIYGQSPLYYPAAALTTMGPKKRKKVDINLRIFGKFKRQRREYNGRTIWVGI